jgi:predicted DNA-binding transcriptional regulator
MRRVYDWILKQGQVRLGSMAKELRLSDLQLAMALKKLLDLNLIRFLPGGESIIALRPDAAAAEILLPLQNQIQSLQRVADEARNEFDALLPLYINARSNNQLQSDAIDRVLDDQSVTSLLHEAADGCQQELSIMQPGGYGHASHIKHLMGSFADMTKRDVQIRLLYQNSARYDPATRTAVKMTQEWGVKHRTVGELVAQMLVFDRRIAFLLPDLDSTTDGVVIVRDPSVVAFVCSIFDHQWSHGRKFEGRVSGAERQAISSDLKRDILRLMMEGLRDDSIARRMGISVRACRRHIAEIMDNLGAESRFQAGYLTAARYTEGSGQVSPTVPAARGHQPPGLV